MTKAIQLAEYLEGDDALTSKCDDAAAELRRLAAVEQELAACKSRCNAAVGQADALRQELADLKAAMGEPVGRTYVDGFHHTRVKWLKGLPVVGTELYAKAKP